MAPYATGILDFDRAAQNLTPQHVLQYLARYTHRVAISNQRLIAPENGQVSFRYKDYQ